MSQHPSIVFSQFPWEVERPYNERGLYIVAVDSSIVAKVWSLDDLGQIAVNNGRLLAAAPRLLTSLSGLVSEIPEVNRGLLSKADVQRVQAKLDAARNLIASVRG